VAIYSSTGALLNATGDQSGVWTSTGQKLMNLARAMTLVPGAAYYVAVLSVGTTPPQLARGAAAGVSSFNQTGAALRFAVNGTGLTKAPGSLTLGSSTNSGAFSVWCGLV
jgi:hypothetical protein